MWHYSLFKVRIKNLKKIKKPKILTAVFCIIYIDKIIILQCKKTRVVNYFLFVSDLKLMNKICELNLSNEVIIAET